MESGTVRCFGTCEVCGADYIELGQMYVELGQSRNRTICPPCEARECSQRPAGLL